MHTSQQYSRQVILPEVGTEGQLKLQQARVLVVGAGGLGCPVLQYLAAAGIGTIGIIDPDVVSLSNLHRQILYIHDDIGAAKAPTAAARLQKLNPATTFKVYDHQLTNSNAFDIIPNFDVVVDGSDNFATRYLVNDACVLLQKPLVYGSVFQFEGQVAVFNYNGSLHYRHLFAEPPARGEVPDCAEAGVLGVLPGIIGSLMAGEVLKMVLQTGELLVNKVLTYQALQNTFFDFQLQQNPAAEVIAPKDRFAYEQTDYGITCPVGATISQIGGTEFLQLVKDGIPCIDVREPGELPLVTVFENECFPLSSLRQGNMPALQNQLLLFCKSGVRSQQAAQLIASRNAGITIYCLAGGINTLNLT